MDSLLRKCYIDYFLRGFERIRPGAIGRIQPGVKILCAGEGDVLICAEPNDGKLGAFRLSGKFKMVHEDEYHSLLEQSRFVQGEAWPVTFGQLLS